MKMYMHLVNWHLVWENVIIKNNFEAMQPQARSISHLKMISQDFSSSLPSQL